MTTLSTLRQLAQAAVRPHDDVDFMECEACFSISELREACSPDVILRLIACVEAADAVRLGNDCPMCDSGKLRNPNNEHWDTCAYAAYDRVRAALDAGTKP